MKRAIAIFAVAFVVMSGVGFIAGRQSIADADLATSVAIQSISLEQQNDYRDQFFTYRQNGALKYRWDIERKRLDTFVDASDVQSTITMRDSLPFPVTTTQFLAFVGGAFAWKVKDFAASQESPSTVRNVIAASLGAVSGFAVGYKLATMRLPSPSGPEVRRKFNDPEFWRKHERDMYFEVWRSVYSRIALIDDKAERARREDVVKYLGALAFNRRSGLKAIDLEWLSYQGTVIAAHGVRSALNPPILAKKRAPQGPASPTAVASSAASAVAYVPATKPSIPTPFWLRWWFILAGVAVAVSSTFACGYFIDRRTRAQEAASQKPLIIRP